MNCVRKFPKIFAIGHRTLARLFDGPVEITEKVDGSAFSFGKIEGYVSCRSKNKQLFPEHPDAMFQEAVKQVERIADLIPDNTTFWGEYLKKPKHNVLAYDRTPKNHIMLFGMECHDDPDWTYSYAELCWWATKFGLDVAKVIYIGQINSHEQLQELLKQESYLGGPKIEGIVAKAWDKSALIGDQYIWPLAGKYVAEKFKEKMGQRKFGNKGKWEDYKQSFRTEARWQKAIIHKIEDGSLLYEPKDIGPLLKELNQDLIREHKDEIMEFLWKHHGKEVCRTVTAGFPEYYKEWLMKRNFDNEKGTMEAD